MNSDYIIRAKYQRKIDENLSQCLTCERECKISDGKFGFCKTRTNKKGEIYSIVYGMIPALSYNPIEKKPLYHFYPGSTAITIGTYGCNFNCFWCQNYHLSKTNPLKAYQSATSGDYISPKKLIEIALNKKCNGTSISFNEPTLLFEYSLEVFKLAKEKNLYNTYVTNGYMTEDVLKDLADAGLDAMNIDIKGDSDMVEKYCGIDGEKVWRNAKLAKDLDIHVEITTLLIPGFNSEKHIIRKLSKRIFNELGELTPYHITRFFPHFKSKNHGLLEPTARKLLYNAHSVAKEVGLKYVYLGNLPPTDYGNTYCPKCAKLVIKRNGMEIKELYLSSTGKCNFCGFPICIVS